MDPARVEAYLRSICSVLDFDIGELWSVNNIPGRTPNFKFIQLYTSPTYEDFHSLLIRPAQMVEKSEPPQLDEEKHRFSPIICRGVCDGGQIVWANTCTSQGLIGRTDLPLNTAMGMPICSVDNDLYILVLFAVESIPVSTNAVEFLCTMARAVTETSSGFLPASFANIITPAKTEQFVGVWDMMELIEAYSNDVAFHLLPIGKVQQFLDYQEISSFREIFYDFKCIRDGRFTVKQVDALRLTNGYRDRSDSDCWSLESVAFGSEEEMGPGAFSVDVDSTSSLSGSDHDSDAGVSEVPGIEHPLKVLIDARTSYRTNQSRFHEFMVAALGMTVFDAAELWLLSERSAELYVVAALHRDGLMHLWTANSKDVRLSRGMDVPGQVYETAQPYWDKAYDKHPVRDPNYPRAALASRLNVRTAFGVPLPGSRGTVGVLTLYSRNEVEPEPLMVSLVVQASNLIVAGSLDPFMLGSVGIESIVQGLPQRSIKEGNSKLAGRLQLLSGPVFGDHDRDAAVPSALVLVPQAADNGMPPQTITRPTINLETKGSLALPRSNLAFAYGLPAGFEKQTGLGSTNCPPKGVMHLKSLQSVPIGRPSSHPALQHVLSTSITKMLDTAEVSSLPPKYTVADIQSYTTGPMAVGRANLMGLQEEMKSNLFPLPQIREQSSSTVISAAGHVPGNKGPRKLTSVAADLVRRGQAAGLPVAGLKRPTGKQHGKAAADKVLEAKLSSPSEHAIGTLSDLLLPAPTATTDADSPSKGTAAQDGVSMIRLCKMDGCRTISPRSPYCPAHTGSRRCQHDGCTKCAQGSTNFCIAHGGGRRCTYPGCVKGARDKFFCAGHGGGKRCVTNGCTKSAVGGSKLCTAHGGGKRCKVDGCTKSSQSSTMFCVRHGGGRKCSVDGCTKVARGRTDFCAAHGGGVRCCVDNCNKAAIGKYQLCRTHHSSITGEELVENDDDADDVDGDVDDDYVLDGAGTEIAVSEELLKLSSVAAGNTNNALRQKAAEVFESMNGRARSQSQSLNVSGSVSEFKGAGQGAVIVVSASQTPSATVSAPVTPLVTATAIIDWCPEQLEYSAGKRALIASGCANKKARP